MGLAVFNNKLMRTNTKLFALPPAPTLIYSAVTENTNSGSETVTHNVSLGTSRYILVNLDEKISSTFGACNLWIEFNTVSGTWPSHSQYVWRFRSHNRWRYSHPIRCCMLNTSENPADWVSNRTADAKGYNADGESNYYYKTSSTSTVPYSTNYVTHSLLIDTSVGIASHYINGTFTCKGNLVTGGTLKAIAKVKETGMYYIYKNLYVYGSDNYVSILSKVGG